MTEEILEKNGLVTFAGNALTLLGELPNIGDIAPDFNLLRNDLSEVNLQTYVGKQLIISVVPSLDTPVCDKQTRKFNEDAASLQNTVVLTISMDLPFAQTRWCAAAGIKNVETLSDHRLGSFGKSYGVLIKELRLLTRAIFILSPEHKITYTQLVPEIKNEPDYEAALSQLKLHTGLAE